MAPTKNEKASGGTEAISNSSNQTSEPDFSPETGSGATPRKYTTIDPRDVLGLPCVCCGAPIGDDFPVGRAIVIKHPDPLLMVAYIYAVCRYCKDSDPDALDYLRAFANYDAAEGFKEFEALLPPELKGGSE
jgi:hypothetical protein